jgi:glycosyltransferase involved in cell wall biosynthesis
LDEAAVVFSGSDHTSSVLREVLGAGLYEDRIEILPPGVDTRNFHPSRGSMDALLSTLGGVDRGERGPDPDAADKLGSVERFVLYAGKLMEQKGVGTLLEAWGRIHHDFPGIDLVVVGFGDERQRLESQAAGLPVVFTGGFSHEELQMLMPLAQTVVVPSILAEAFGMIAAEAASSGVVPLVADHSGLAEVAAGLGDAVVTFDGSPEDLAGKLASLLRMPAAERRDLGAVARRRAVERWSWDSVAGRFGSIVEGRL